MKYLIKNQKEFIITLGVLVTILLVIFWCVWSIIDGSFTYKNLIAIAGEIFTILGWYYNMPTTFENRKATDLMRLEKAQKSGKIDGENFFDYPDEIYDEEPFDFEDEIDSSEEVDISDLLGDTKEGEE